MNIKNNKTTNTAINFCLGTFIQCNNSSFSKNLNL